MSGQVFGLLDMHEQLDSHMATLSDVLSNTNSGSVLRDLRALHDRLQVEIQETFAELLGSISRDPSKNTGKVSADPLSSSVSKAAGMY